MADAVGFFVYSRQENVRIISISHTLNEEEHSYKKLCFKVDRLVVCFVTSYFFLKLPFKPTVRLKTILSSLLSLSTLKYPVRSN